MFRRLLKILRAYGVILALEILMRLGDDDRE